MRFALPLIAFAIGAQALTNPLLAKRTSLDICASVDAGLKVPNPLNGQPLVIGIINVCLCISAIPDFLKTNLVAVAAVDLVGAAQVQATLAALINSAPGQQQCTYPDYAVPVCSSSNPCGFTCPSGSTPSPANHPTQCVCSGNKVLCNGKCKNTCPSSAPDKRDLRQRAICDKGFTPCGTYAGFSRSKDAYECVNASSDLESCGGCYIPLDAKSPIGTDCTSLPGVADVTCRSGSCLVHRCMPGYELSFDKSMCINVEAWSKLASDYGLEHVPMGSA